MLSNRRRTAIHECGHLLGTLSSPLLPQPEAVSVEPDHETHGRMFWGIDLDRRTLDSVRLEEACVVLLAGLAAEEHALGADGPSLTLEEAGANCDLRAVARLLVAHAVRGAAADALVQRAMERARRAVARTWPLLDAVAGVLERAGTLGPEGIAATRGALLAMVNVRLDAEATVLHALKSIAAEETARSAVATARRAPRPSRPWGRA